jgi:DNA-binding Lrp family transcriptional regulator
MPAFVKAITELGPNINLVCKKMGVFRETGRYWYTKKLLAKGYTVQAAVAYERLGLKYVIMVVDFEDDFEKYAKPILWAMSELCYVRYYNGTLPGGDYIVHAIVPEEHVAAYTLFFGKLRDMGIFHSVNIFVADWHRNVPMRTESFDFERGVWDFDWGKLSERHGEKDEMRPQGKADFDRLDLEILKQLQLDASTTFTKIAVKAGSTMKNTQYHHWKHVVGRGLIRNYRVNWLGTRYDYSREKAMHRMHRQLLLNLVAARLSESEKLEVRAGLNQFPCLWAEAVGEGHYYAEIAFPTDAAAEGYAALARALHRIRRKYTLYVADHTNGIGFTLNPKLYDPAENAWQFKSSELLPRFEELTLKIGQGA